MRPNLVSTFVWALLVVLAARVLRADDTLRSTAHPVALGSRLTVRTGQYTLGGLGGQLRVRLHPRVAVDLYADGLAGREAGQLRHDHEIGGAVNLHTFGGARWVAGPLLGFCAQIAVMHPSQADTLYDLRVGARAGFGVEWALGAHFSATLQGFAVAWLGHAFEHYGFTATTQEALSLSPSFQAVSAIHYWF
ncbi:MAG: hypothetical protein JNK72_27040 [Myxococcales bacterium]|nr:hypothetical protein [Myxococcales bacterium]